MTKVILNDQVYDFATVAHYMDDDLRESLQEFFDAYCMLHLRKFGKEFVIN